jgi:hypothetical protein
MVTTTEGIYANDRVILLELIRGITRARVAISLPSSSYAGRPSFLPSLGARRRERLTPKKEFARAQSEAMHGELE